MRDARSETDGALPDVTLIVCTRDRPGALARCLASIGAVAAAAPGIGIELILVDNSPRHSAAGVFEGMDWPSNLAAELVYEPVQGLARARNAALRAARGGIIACTDDDCRLQDGYFEGLMQAFAQQPGPAVMGGLVALGDARDLEYTVRHGDTHERFHRGLVPGGFLLGCNLAFNRAAFARIGLFDTRFGAGVEFRSAEDTDYLIRAYEEGVPVIYSPHFAVSHFHGRSSRAAITAVHKDYNFGNGALLAKHLRSSPWLGRQFGWLVRGCLREAVIGRRFDTRLGLSHFPVLAATLAGMRRYWMRPRRERMP